VFTSAGKRGARVSLVTFLRKRDTPPLAITAAENKLRATKA
jgi:hypothetical protein